MDLSALLNTLGPYERGTTESKDANTVLVRCKPYGSDPVAEEAVFRLLGIMVTSQESDEALKNKLQSVIDLPFRSELLARRLLDGIKILIAGLSIEMGAIWTLYHDVKGPEDALSDKSRNLLGIGMRSTVRGLGVLAKFPPWTIEALGFTRYGPVRGSFAAC